MTRSLHAPEPATRTTLLVLSVLVFVSALVGCAIGVGSPAQGLACVALVPGVMAAMWLASRPRAAFGLFLAVVVAVPVQATVHVGVTEPPTTLAFLLVALAALKAGGRMRLADWWLAGFVVVSAVATLVYDSPQPAMSALLVQGVTAYLVGRRIAPAAGEQWTYRAMATATTIVAVWACIEFAFDWHVFENFVGRTEDSFWRTIQYRGGVARSEGAFGHSIALGGFVAMGIPFVIGGPFSTGRKVVLTAVLAAGVITSLSRGPMLGAALAFLLATLFLPTSRLAQKTRMVLALLGLFVVVIVLPYVLGFFTSLGADETAVSAQYRANLLSHWSEDVNLFGHAKHVIVDPGGTTLYRGFGSIDNAWLELALQFGWVALVVIGLVAAVCVLRVLARKGGPAEIALVSQMLVLGTVAMITQYGPAVWMLVGLGVAFASGKRGNADRPAAAIADPRLEPVAGAGRHLHPQTPSGVGS